MMIKKDDHGLQRFLSLFLNLFGQFPGGEGCSELHVSGNIFAMAQRRVLLGKFYCSPRVCDDLPGQVPIHGHMAGCRRPVGRVISGPRFTVNLFPRSTSCCTIAKVLQKVKAKDKNFYGYMAGRQDHLRPLFHSELVPLLHKSLHS